jgi:hypothetical protein
MLPLTATDTTAELSARAWRPRQHPPDNPRSSTDARLLQAVFLISPVLCSYARPRSDQHGRGKTPDERPDHWTAAAFTAKMWE